MDKKQLRTLIERVMRLKEEQDELSEQIKEIYAEAKGQGFDKTALGQTVVILRKRYRDGAIKCDERNALVGQYLAVFESKSETGTNGATRAHMHADAGTRMLAQTHTPAPDAPRVATSPAAAPAPAPQSNGHYWPWQPAR